ncbi:30S ribosomal protein S17e [Candidatus Woesearchaeota archaeon]|nr:30S ribosomal protein S17e [Candidatus Woesearchaeota archaeon]|tara:strand:- start:6734 stop:6925 length:192 start_codon:yes stop_codon:yes gene_type:complete
MGRIKTKRIKRVTHKLIEENKGKFKDDFNNNKELVNESASIPSKKIRNIIAGYVTRLTKSKTK